MAVAIILQRYFGMHLEKMKPQNISQFKKVHLAPEAGAPSQSARRKPHKSAVARDKLQLQLQTATA